MKPYVFGYHSDGQGNPLPAAYAYALKTKGSCSITHFNASPIYITDALHLRKDEKGKYALYEDVRDEQRRIVRNEDGSLKQNKFENGHIYITRDNAKDFVSRRNSDGIITEWTTDKKVKFNDEIKVTPETAVKAGVMLLAFNGDERETAQFWQDFHKCTANGYPAQLNSDKGKPLLNLLVDNLKNGKISIINAEITQDKTNDLAAIFLKNQLSR